MPLFRATVWTLSAVARSEEGFSAMQRRIWEHSADDEQDFIAIVTDAETRHVDDAVYFGPISRVKR